MKIIKFIFFEILIMCLFISFGNVKAEALNIAVSSNFFQTIKPIIKEFKKKNNDIKIKISTGSTVQLYHQIINGAPYDIYFAADEKHPNLLIEKKLAIRSNYTYACGLLTILYKDKYKYIYEILPLNSKVNSEITIAIANPKTAPYGLAAKEYLLKNFKFDNLNKNIIKGVNVGQVFHFAKTGSVDLAFVALSQVNYYNLPKKNFYVIPKELYQPIKQNVTILVNGKNIINSRNFFNFIQTDNVRNIIKKNGYDVYC